MSVEDRRLFDAGVHGPRRQEVSRHFFDCRSNYATAASKLNDGTDLKYGGSMSLNASCMDT